MATGLLLISQVILCYLTVTTATVYNHNETSEEIPFLDHDTLLSGFRNVLDKDFVIGGLFPVYDCTPAPLHLTLNGLELLEAMLFAIDRINNDMSLLPNLTIGYDVRDTCNYASIGLHEALQLAVAYDQPGNFSFSFLGVIGAANTTVTHPVATLFGLEIIQFPLISYASSDAALSNKDLYKYLLRTIPSDNLQANAMVDLISHFGWEYVSVIFSDDEYGESGSNAFLDGAMQRGICVETEIAVSSSEVSSDNETVAKAVKALLNSKTSVVVVFADEYTVLALFEELNRTSTTSKFVWIASDRWARATSVRNKFPEIAKEMFGFSLYTEHVEEFIDYFSHLNYSSNIRNSFFQRYPFLARYCDRYYVYLGSEPGSGSGSGSRPRFGYRWYCPEGVTDNPDYSHEEFVPFVIDAVYAFAHGVQNFLDNNCDSPIRWNRTAQQCDGMKLNLTGENLLGYLYNVTFNGIQNRSISFDEDGDPPGVYEIIRLQINENGTGEYVSVGLWDSLRTEDALQLNVTIHFKGIRSTCSEPCRKGYIHSIANPNCPSCFECIPCVGPTYSMNSSGTNCSLCSDNYWGNNPLSGSTHCVPVEVQHLDFSNGWSITSMCIASITLIILAIITVIFVMTWNTPVVKSSGREEMVMLLIGIGVCCILTYIVVAPPSTGVCVFQRIGVWLCFSLAFGALLVKIIRVARIFHSVKSSAKRPQFTDPIHQVIFTMVIVVGQLILVVIGLGVDPPVVERDPEVVITSSGQQTGEAPEIIETCQQPHTAILVLLLAYNFLIIVGCTILGLMTMGFPDNFNEAKHVMFTSFTLMVIWVLFMPIYFYTEEEFQSGVLALGIVLSAVALMAGFFFPRVFIIIFQKHKNTKEYMQSTGTGTTQSTNFSKAFQRTLSSNNSFTNPAGILMSKDGMSPDKGTITSDSEFAAHDVKADILEDKAYQPESNTDSSTL